MANVAVLGTGLLGAGFVEAMLRRGDRVTVWNRTLDKARALAKFGAHVAEDPLAAIRGAERVHLILADDEAVDSVVAATWDAIGAPFVDHSTVSPAGALRRTERFAAVGRTYVHAPVFMSPQHARDAQGMIVLSGPAEVVGPVAGWLAAMTGSVRIVGDKVGQAAVVKLLGNAASFGIVAALSDVLTVARANGLDEHAVVDFFEAFNPMVSAKARASRIARRDWRPASFTLAMAHKDALLMLQAAGDAPLLVLPQVAARMAEGMANGDADADFAVMSRP